MRIFIAVLSVATLAFLVWLVLVGGTPPRASVEMDTRPGAYADPRRVLARIQSDLERTAAGRQAWPLPPGVSADPLEAVVAAYRLYLDGNVPGMDARLRDIAAAAAPRLTAAQGTDAETAARIAAHFARLDDAGTATAPAIRLLAGLRLVDGLLFMEAAHWTQADPLTRTAATPLAGTWLRLPCRTVIGRATALAEAREQMGDLAGPLLSCPSDNGDLAVLEAQAKAPGLLPTRLAVLAPRATLPRIEPSPPPTPWDHETAVAWMDEDPDAADSVLRRAEGTASPAEKLDYALFLHAFRPAGPDRLSGVHLLMRAVDAVALPKADQTQLSAIGRPTPYDGGDEALIATLRMAVATDVAPAYAIPCAVLQARPALLEATRPLFGNSRDLFLPTSGCAVGRGAVRGFPDMELAAYVQAAEEADGWFLTRRTAEAAAVLAGRQRAALERLKLDSAGLAAEEPPTLDHPYQVWGLSSLSNRMVERQVRDRYRAAADRLTDWYTRQGIAADMAARAAKTGLFQLVWGAACGDDVPAASLRALLLDNAPAEEIRAVLSEREPPEVQRCAVHAGLDPLLLLAAGHAPGLAVLLESGRAVDERNDFGKTALMVAAQFDRMDSARLLLDRGAAVNATTWMQAGLGLAHDGRTALMYAAASGSLPMVKLLLERGADPHQADTMGRRAVDYLLGFGPVAANAGMSAEDRAEAARLLF